MGRPQSYPARLLRRLRRARMCRNARLVVIGIGGTIVVGAIVTALAWTVPMPIRLYVFGLIHAGLIARLAHLLNFAFLAPGQEAVWQMRGA